MPSSLPDLLDDALRPVFDGNFRERGELGASVAVFFEGKELLHLSGGFADREQTRPWTADTLVPVWSATKGVAALTCLLALEEISFPPEGAVAELWPEFAHGGKEHVTFLQVLSHTAGLCALDEAVPIQDEAAVVAALERQTPVTPPGAIQAYHARTFGFLLEEIVKRATQAPSLGTYFRKRLGDPMNLDFWIGLPEAQMNRVATLYPGRFRPGTEPTPFLQAFNSKGSLTQRAFTSPAGLNAVQDLNRPDTLARGYPSMGGVGSARALAALYGMLAQNGIWQGETLVSQEVLYRLGRTLTQQNDAVLHTELAFSAGMMRDPVNTSGDKFRQIFGSGASAFGHPGAGGSLAFADSDRRLSFAYVMNQMELGVLPNAKSLDLVSAMDTVLPQDAVKTQDAAG